MIINNQEYDIDKLIDEEKSSFLKRRENGLLLSDEDINILNKYHIDYLKTNNIKELLFLIDEVLIEEEGDDLEELSFKLGEYNYYYYTNK